ncbi:MAG TPA: sigma-54 dependent transcriptional regulator [Acidobacteriaceae bacterium]|nr:sigma-54 dependent transcriptional regulator [Acidobacteriaceae bacterium]
MSSSAVGVQQASSADSPLVQSTSSGARILVIDDEAGIRDSLETLLTLEGFSVDLVPEGSAGLDLLTRHNYDLLLLDLSLPGESGIELLPRIKSLAPELPVIMITAYGTVGNVVDAIRAGASNFVQKPWDNEKLLADLRSAIGKQKAETEVVQLKRILKQRYSFKNIVGKSDVMLRLFDLVSQVAPSRSTILIQGESGTGKELIAKAIHANSPRRDKPFIPVNTGAVPSDLLESTLFGHERGAFTSAVAAKKGLFEVADQGTLFLDEIGTMSIDMQAKILRVLQDRRFMRLGGTQEIQVDVRIVAATNVNLQQAVKEGRFREDLFYRLNVICLELPPLRSRKEDIPLLAQHYLKFYADENAFPTPDLTPDALRVLMEYEWPGNVRELENVIERCVVLSTGAQGGAAQIGPDLFPAQLRGNTYSTNLLEQRPDASLFDVMEDIERRIISDRLERCNWNQTDAAEYFRIPLSTLNQKIKRLNIEIRKRNRE